jgi:hypothetical protein
VDDLTRESAASGVMMLPIPRTGVLEGVHAERSTRAVLGIAGLEITIAYGQAVQPLPEGDRYLGFLFAQAGMPEEVEGALRAAHSQLEIVIAGGGSMG